MPTSSGTSTASLGREHIRIEDVTCLRCRVDFTTDPDHLCGLCRAMGKTAGLDAKKEDADFSPKNVSDAAAARSAFRGG